MRDASRPRPTRRATDDVREEGVDWDPQKIKPDGTYRVAMWLTSEGQRYFDVVSEDDDDFLEQIDEASVYSPIVPNSLLSGRRYGDFIRHLVMAGEASIVIDAHLMWMTGDEPDARGEERCVTSRPPLRAPRQIGQSRTPRQFLALCAVKGPASAQIGRGPAPTATEPVRRIYRRNAIPTPPKKAIKASGFG